MEQLNFLNIDVPETIADIIISEMNSIALPEGIKRLVDEIKKKKELLEENKQNDADLFSFSRDEFWLDIEEIPNLKAELQKIFQKRFSEQKIRNIDVSFREITDWVSVSDNKPSKQLLFLLKLSVEECD